jgi:serine/threonine protein kinase
MYYRGTTSVVKKATKKASGDLVALKIIDKRFVDPDAVVKEVAIMKELDDHPGFIHVKEVFEDNTNLILVEDLVTGKTLDPLKFNRASIKRGILSILLIIVNDWVFFRRRIVR